MSVKPKYSWPRNLFVRDAERSKKWYEDVLGLHTYEYRPGWAAFMSADREQSHEVALMQLGPQAPLQQKGQVGLNHMAWRLDSLEDQNLPAHQGIECPDRAGSPITAFRSASICAIPTATASRSITKCPARNGRTRSTSSPAN